MFRGDTLVTAVILSMACCAAAHAADQGEVFRYTFDQQSRRRAVDKSGNDIHARIRGAKPVKSVQGFALQFSGADDYIEIPDRPELRGQAFTFEFWVKPKAGSSPLVARKFSDIRSSYLLHLNKEGTRLYCCVLDPDGSTEHWVDTSPQQAGFHSIPQKLLGRWAHVAFTCDGRWVRIYLDGTLEAFAPVGKLPQQKQKLIPYVKNPVNIGRSYYAPKWSYFKGLLAEVRGYNRALTDDEIREHFNEGNPAVLAKPAAPAIGIEPIKPLPTTAVPGDDAITLVADGKPRATIVIPSGAKYWTAEAARWLQHYLELATGAKLSIAGEETAPTGTLISVGHTQMAKRAGIGVDDLKWDGGKIVAKGDNLFLIGRDVKDSFQSPDGRIADGNCRAVVMFLEDVVGIRWFLPGPEGVFIPKRRDLRVSRSLSRRFVPAIAFSGGRFPFGSKGQWLENITPAAIANNYRNGIAATSGGHTYYAMVPKELFAEHPEYFALINGKRTVEGHHLCSTNPDVKRLLVEGLKKEFARGLDVVTLGQEDGYYRCQCENCEKLDKYRFSEHLRKTGISWRDFQNQILPDTPCERLFLLHKAVIDEVHKTYPKGVVLLMCYAPTAWPSKVIGNWGDNVWIEMTNQGPEYLKAWRGKAGGLTGYVYWFDIQLSMGMDIHATPDEAAEHLRFLYENGFVGFYQFPETNFGFAGPVIYMLGKLMGDPYLDHKALIEEYCHGVFSAAGDTMLRFYDVLYTNRERKFPMFMHRRAWPKWMSTSDLYMMLYTPPVLEKLDALLTEAEAKADTDMARGWLKHTRDWFDFTKLLTDAVTAYRLYERNKTYENWVRVKQRVDAFDAYRMKILTYDDEYAARWFPGHPHFCNWLTGDTQHESKVYYTEWKKRRPAALKRGVKGVAIGYGGGLVEIVTGYSRVRKPLTLDFNKDGP